MEILHIFLLPGIKTGKFGRKWKLGRRKCRLRRDGEFYAAARQQGGFRACGRELLSFHVERKQPKNAT